MSDQYTENSEVIPPAQKLPAFQMQMIMDFSGQCGGILQMLKQLNPPMFNEVMLMPDLQGPENEVYLLDYISGTTLYTEAAAKYQALQINPDDIPMPKIKKWTRFKWWLKSKFK